MWIKKIKKRKIECLLNNESCLMGTFYFFLENNVTIQYSGKKSTDEDFTLFKFSVEQAMMMHVLAYTCEIDENTLNKLRGYCVMECKRINGAVTFDDAVKFQNSSD